MSTRPRQIGVPEELICLALEPPHSHTSVSTQDRVLHEPQPKLCSRQAFASARGRAEQKGRVGGHWVLQGDFVEHFADAL